MGPQVADVRDYNNKFLCNLPMHPVSMLAGMHLYKSKSNCSLTAQNNLVAEGHE
jgi:hypothetical protein